MEKSFRLVAGYHKNVCVVGIIASELINDPELLYKRVIFHFAFA